MIANTLKKGKSASTIVVSVSDIASYTSIEDAAFSDFRRACKADRRSFLALE